MLARPFLTAAVAAVVLVGGPNLMLAQEEAPANGEAQQAEQGADPAKAEPSDNGPQADDAVQADDPPAAGERVGRMIRLELPIDGRTFARARRFVRRVLDQAREDDLRPVLIFEFGVMPNQEEFGRGSEFGSAYELADFLSGPELNAATTVAYLPDSVQGHAVLAVLACDEIIMAPEAEIGVAGADEDNVNPALVSAYREIAMRRKTIPVEMALGLLDPGREVLEVETEVSREYVSPEGLEELKQRRTVQSSRVLIPAGEAGRFTGAEGRRLGFVSYLASNPQEVARALELPPEAVEEDPSLGGDWRAVRVDLKGPIDSERSLQLQRLIQDEISQNNVNFVCLWIDSPGGSAADAMQLANFLAFDLDPGNVRTVAYIPREARSDAAIVAVACDQVVMHGDALLGGPGAYDFSEEEIAQMRETIRSSLAPRKSRSWSLLAALVDPDLDVYRYDRDGQTEYFSEEELAEQANPDAWEREQPVTTPGEPLQIDGATAEEYRLATATVDSFQEFKRLYGLENDPALLEPGWADFLIEALASPGVAVLLLIIAGVGTYAELQSPGIGVGGFLAAVCFLLFFWSRYLGGTAGWLEGMLFLAGIAFLLMEIFVLPGFGVFGLGGGALVLISLILASQTFVLPHNAYQFAQLQRSLLVLAGAAVGIVAVAVSLRRWLPHTPFFSQMFLPPPNDEEAEVIKRRESLVGFDDSLVGRRGVTTTQLTPSGKARFGDEFIDVIADGELIEPGTEIVVVEVHGYRVVVESAPKETS